MDEESDKGAVKMTELEPLRPSGMDHQSTDTDTERGADDISIPIEEGPSTAGSVSDTGKEKKKKKKEWIPQHFKKRECNTFIEDPSSDVQCQCGRPRDHPTHIDTAVEGTDWSSELHSSEHPTDAYGLLGCRHFVRLSSDTQPSLVYDLMTREEEDGGWGCARPNLLVSVFGGEGSAEVKPWVQKVIRQGLVKKRGWILTEGFDEGVGRCVGEAVRGSSEASALGITPWGFVHNRDQLVNAKGGRVRYSVGENTTSKSYSLEKNHRCFLLVDDGSEGRRGGETNFRVKLEEHISTQHIRDCNTITVPVLRMLIGGELSLLERVGVSLDTPWLVLAGSGGVADLLSDVLKNQSPGSAGVDVAEVVRKHFPSEVSEVQTDQLVDQIKSIIQNRKLITFYHEEQGRPEDFDTVLIKALMPASKQRASGNSFPYSKELFLTMRWNRFDLASSQLFTDDLTDDDINWKDEALMECMAFALTNHQTQFVRLFIEKKFNIHEYLTYGHLETLYSGVRWDTQLYKMLLERLNERLGTSDLDSLKDVSLFEVSGVLKRLMQGGVKQFYLTVLEHSSLEGYRNQLCLYPWFDVFIWAVLQNHSDMAVFFWEKTEEPVLNALSACKMLREMSKKEYETETKHSITELSQKFEDRAHDMMGSCYQSGENGSFELLTRESPVWGTDCFQMAIAAESLPFFNHDGLESVLNQAWWGRMMKDTPVWKFLLTLFCPVLLLCTNLISFWGSDDISGWKKFWGAPITKFVGNAVMYILFLCMFAYMLLVPPSGPPVREYLLYFWVFTFLCEEIRQASSVGYGWLYWTDLWNMCDLVAIILFIFGLICRMFEGSYEFGRGVLCTDYMVFTLRLIRVFAVDKQLGTKIITVRKMMKDVFSFLFFLGVWLLAYGVANQALLYSYDPNPHRVFRRMFYRPYLYIFGDFNFGEIDVTQPWDMDQKCTANMTLIEGGAEPCRRGSNNGLVIILLVVFLLVTNILLINLLIAILSNTFNVVEEKSKLYWRRQYYNIIMEYQSRPRLAPPFIIISHLHLFIKKVFQMERFQGERFRGSGFSEERCCVREPHNKHQRRGERLRVPLPEWEKDHNKKFLAAQRKAETSSDSKRLEQISDKVDRVKRQVTETIDQRIQQMTDRVDTALKQLTETTVAFDQRQRDLETKVGLMLDLLTKAPWAKPPST